MTSEEETEIVTILRDINAKVDAMQRSQAAMKLDIVQNILDILKQKWKDEAAKRRERTWT